MDAGLVLVGIVSGVVSSAMFYFLLRGLRPTIEISPFIALVDRGGEKYFDFKIINKSKRALVDVRAHASIAKLIYAEGGPVYQTNNIPLIRDHYFELGPYRKNDKEADFALRFATKFDISDKWDTDADHIKLRIIATDSVSGFSRAFTRVFTTKRNSIKGGIHKFGEDLEVS